MSQDAVAPLSVSGMGYRISDRVLFNELDLLVPKGQSVAIMGPSGCGKSTLLSAVLGLVKPHSGAVSVMGVDVTRLKGDRLAELRSEHIGMVFQFGELIPELTPLENVLLAAQLAGRSDESARERAEQLVDDFGVPQGTMTDDLSGGERQRLAVARALMNRPSLVLADEPTGALDTATKDQVADRLFALPQAHDCAVVVVTHDPDVATRADRVLAIADGKLVPRAEVAR